MAKNTFPDKMNTSTLHQSVSLSSQGKAVGSKHRKESLNFPVPDWIDLSRNSLLLRMSPRISSSFSSQACLLVESKVSFAKTQTVDNIVIPWVHFETFPEVTGQQDLAITVS